MIRKTAGLFAVLAFALSLRGAAAVEQPPPGAIHVITVQQAITAATARYVRSALEQAAATQAECLVIQLDTPGGLLDATREIVQDILSAPLPVVVYIAPAGARGASAGTIISMASHVAAMAPATHIGAAHPVSIFGGSDDNKVMGEKILNDTAAYIESLAHLRPRNVEWAISAVRESKSVIADKALELKVIDLIAEDLGDLVRQLQGREVRMSRERVVMLQTEGHPIVMQDMSISQSFMSLVSNPNLVFLLLIIGLVGLYMELSNPGLIFPGVLGAMSLLIALIAMQTLPVSYGALALMLLGVALLVAEAFVPSFGVLGIGGLACLLIGALFLLDQSLTDLRISRPMIFAAVGVVGLAALVVGRLLVKSQRMRPRSAQDNLIGGVGRVRSPITPPHAGQVLLNGELWRARAQVPLAADEEVVVEAVEGLLLTVAKVSAASRAQSES